jgi:hypothetical protein
MTTIEPPRRGTATTPLLLAAACAILAMGILVGEELPALALGASLLAVSVVSSRPTISWRSALIALVLVILFIPIRRYRFPVDLPFQLEPYRLLVLLILAGWVASLLSDQRVRLRRSGLEGPVFFLLAATAASIVANPSRFNTYEATVLKSFTFFLSFFIVLYVVVSVVRDRRDWDPIVKTLVGGGAVVALLAVIEGRTGVSPFARLDSVLPLLVPEDGGELTRGGTTRVKGSAEHPIALSAALVMLIPLAIYLARNAGNRWWLACGALALGAFSTVSRTGPVMLLVVGAVFLALRPRETKRVWPLLVPVVIATHFALPGTLGSLRYSFFPEGGLIQQQRHPGANCDSGGRIADIGPTVAEVKKKPFFGYGFGTRVVTGPEQNACVLDNQWLGTFYELGIVGALAWLFLFLAVLRRLGGSSKEDDTARGWLLVAVTASVTAYAAGMATYDALGFIQVTFLLFIILGLGAAAAASRREAAPHAV